jgi:lipopolysaccharide transport system ATP-binding protein
MSDIAIKVENISKRYRIGLKEETKDTFLGAMGSILRSPLGNLKKLKKLTKFQDDNKEHEDIIWALKDVSFEVKKGEVIGIIGANGAGKSTLLKILAQITHPTSGRVELNGRVASLLEVGTGFHSELTGRENIYLNGTILGMTKKEINRKMDEIIEFSGVEKFIDTPVKKYSSGMGVRLAFSVAAHLEPEILLIDEVLAVGDAKFQKKSLGKMGEISSQKGKTVLFVSHNMTAIQRICSSCICLKGGLFSLKGKTTDVVSQYISDEMQNVSSKVFDIKTGNINNEIQLLAVELSTEASIIDLNTKLDFRIMFLCISLFEKFYVNFILRSITNEIIYEFNSEIIEPNNNKIRIDFPIPTDVLNEGKYFIQVNFTTVGIRMIGYKENILSFELKDGSPDKSYFKRSGYIRVNQTPRIKI